MFEIEKQQKSVVEVQRSTSSRSSKGKEEYIEGEDSEEETMEEEQSHKLFQQLCEKFHLTQYQQYEAKALIKKMVAFGLIVDFELFFQKGRSVKCWIDAAKKQIHEFSLGVF